MSDNCRVLIVDDEPDLQASFSRRIADRGLHVSTLHPSEVGIEDVAEADLVLVDYFLSNWPEANASPIASIYPANGIALAAVLRSRLDITSDRPTAFALRTGDAQSLPTEYPGATRDHAYARAENLEWVFSKEGPGTDDSVISLCEAVGALPSSWNADPASRGNLVKEILRLPTSAWSDTAWEDVVTCHPPLHESAIGSDGIGFLRWLLHRILPYPCFLYDQYRLAVRAGTTVDFVRAALDAGLRTTLSASGYLGVLSHFEGEYWWGAGVEALLWEGTSGASYDLREVRRWLLGELDGDAPLIESPVLAIGPDYSYSAPLTVTDGVRVQPDDWPPYAEGPWALATSLAESPTLAATVVPQRGAS